MKRTPEYVEGPEAWTRFANGMRKVLTVPHAEIKRRIDAERMASAANPHRRGPKSKKKREGHDPDAAPHV
jgi:hypothetical protein